MYARQSGTQTKYTLDLGRTFTYINMRSSNLEIVGFRKVRGVQSCSWRLSVLQSSSNLPQKTCLEISSNPEERDQLVLVFN